MKIFLPVIVIVFFSCSVSRNQSVNTQTGGYTDGGKIITSMFQQRAGEYKALCLQGYNIALLRVQNYVLVNDKPKAIILDLDETILDNSAYAVNRALQAKGYDLESWQQWTSLGDADTMAGSVTFLKNAAKMGVEMFYISNRGTDEQMGTLKNLQKFNLPNADEAHLFLKTDGSSKEGRRQKVLQDHQVILYMGDNLADFSSMWDKKTEEVRNNEVLTHPSLFGDKFIVFPNSNYGDWEGAFYKYNYKLTEAQKDSVLRHDLRSYK